MSLDLFRRLVETRISTFMASNYPSVPVKYQNVEFIQPDGIFLSVSPLEGEAFRTNLGTPYIVRHPGLLQIDVLLPENTGTSQASLIAKALGDHFREKDLTLDNGDRAVFRVPSYPYSEDKRGYSRIMIRIPYHRDETVLS